MVNGHRKIFIITILFITILTTYGYSQEEGIKPFNTDGCSHFPNGTLTQKELWLKCCIEHDKLYWQGGTYEERKNADMALKTCVAGVGEPEIAELMLQGVRVGGSPYFPTEFRWGYGWPYLGGYKALSPNEKNIIKKSLQQSSNEKNNRSDK